MADLSIGHVLAAPFPARRGTQAWVSELCRAQLEAGHAPQLFCYGAALGGSLPAGLPIHRARRLPFVRAALYSAPTPERPLNDLMLLGLLLRAARGTKLDLLHGHNAEGGAIALIAGKALGLPVVYQVHGSLGGELQAWARASRILQSWPLGTAMLGALGRGTDRSLPWLAGRCLRLHAGQAGLGPVLPLGVPRAPAGDRFLPFAARAPRVVYTGNLDPYQDPARLAAVSQILSAPRAALELVLLTGANEEGLGQWGQALAAPGPIGRWLPLPERFEDELSFIARSRVMLLTRTEGGGLPLKLLNGLAVGTPGVVPWGVAQSLTEDQGVVHCHADPEVMAATVLSLGQDPRRWSRLAKAAARFALAHPWAEVAKACDRHYRDLLY